MANMLLYIIEVIAYETTMDSGPIGSGKNGFPCFSSGLKYLNEAISPSQCLQNTPHPHCEIVRKKIFRLARICEIRKNLAMRKLPDIR